MTKDVVKRDIVRVPLDELHFDPNNPRFSRYFSEGDQPVDKVIERMIKAENVQELMGSIGEQGYFSGEPLLVSRTNGALYVVEGNRRLAALKLLSGLIKPSPPLPSIEALKADAKETPSEVECIIFEDRKDILRYLGYRHITGPKRWDSLSKARYLKQLKDTFYKDLPDDEQLRAIAKEIGSRKDYVAQMLTGLTVFDKASQAGFYGLQRVQENDVDFSVLTTALSYTNISKYLGLESRTDIDAHGLREDHAHDVFSWMFAQDQQGDTILGESRNLRKLSSVVANQASVEVLKREKNLAIAYLHTEGPANAFSKTLDGALKKLNEAYDLLPTVDRFSEENKAALAKIEDQASDISLLVTKALRKQKMGGDTDA
ncbi:ParB N-terminal domain-containing protein [Pseudomonas sp. TNT2022 ID1044]|uniref:ParB N-terminal domain-containing protein n=1 Tax=Pseudomonas sp. TNT2022 ID1044 TaxID=2942636 RepID=UPI002361C31F|nr:ParB N-terminal domain-containing protein [Pseudomonas sp. TNT2022 ID1044]MDD0998491.1 ParB N-terminal domain-containing protein [Pseudomonas sp. TNT2022 ID1044]